MSDRSELHPVIHIKGAREHNLQNVEVVLPRDRMTVITGVSGSGKSSLAFDTLYAEGYRKYIDSLSTSARQLLDQVKRPEVDFINGLSPVIAIEQRTGANTNPRATVATVTELSDYARLLWAVGAEARCPNDGASVERRSIDDCIARIFQEPDGSRLMILAPYVTARPAILRDELPHLRQRGFQRIRIEGAIRELEEPNLIEPGRDELSIDVVIDRIILARDQRARIADSLELAFREGKDRAIILAQSGRDSCYHEFTVSQHFACTKCGSVYEPLSARHFSYNHVEGACPTCGGLGRTMQFVPELIIPDGSRSVRNGAIKPWRLGSKRMIIQRNAILKQLAEQLPFDPEKQWNDLPDAVRDQILHGAGDRMFSFKLTGGNHRPVPQPFQGVLADLEETRRTTSSDGLKARLMAYQVSSECQGCRGQRLNAFSRSARLHGCGFAEFMRMDIAEAQRFILKAANKGQQADILREAFSGLSSRLGFLLETGLHYLTLDRAYDSLSGGEAQRVRLATQLGMGLVGVCYVLDEPTIGLHPRDNERLIRSLLDLQSRGNAVVVVEHDEETMRAAGFLIELGPGAGPEGGRIIFTGTPDEAVSSAIDKGSQTHSRVGMYLSHMARVSHPSDRRRPGNSKLTVIGARENNLRNVDATFPVGLLTVVSGVSGSGKSTLVNDILANAAALRLNRAKTIPGRHRTINGLEYFRSVVRVDQSPIGRSPRSNPATYTKVFDDLRALYSKTSLSRIRGYTPTRFSFNVSGGRCERCSGDGAIRLDMQFLNDVYTECPSCLGRRYNRETLEIRYKGLNIADALDLPVSEALSVFRNHPKIVQRLETLNAVGLGYIRLGQPANTLSGGEAQRIKLSLELSKRQQGETLYVLDEPTTGLHWDDIQRLMDLLFRLRDANNTLVIIEHNLDVICMADWLIDLGPGGGSDGGNVLYAGPVDGIIECPESATGSAVKQHLSRHKT